MSACVTPASVTEGARLLRAYPKPHFFTNGFCELFQSNKFNLGDLMHKDNTKGNACLSVPSKQQRQGRRRERC